jgi:ankyrin repeat protein
MRRNEEFSPRKAPYRIGHQANRKEPMKLYAGLLAIGLSILLLASVQSGCAEDQTEALLGASRVGDLQKVEALLSAGADVNAKAKGGSTALMYASGKGHRSVVELLLAQGADVNAKDKDGSTALMAASGKGHRSIVKLLEEKGAKQ